MATDPRCPACGEAMGTEPKDAALTPSADLTSAGGRRSVTLNCQKEGKRDDGVGDPS
jgi:hypothetical protein